MFQKMVVRVCMLGIVALALPAMVFAETVGVFFNAAVPQDSFAAGDVKAALEADGITVEMKALTDLNASYANKKVVIARASNSAVTAVFTAQGGTVPTGLVEEAYALRTTTTPQTSYWVFGADANGSMYGGFQVAENINFKGYGSTETMDEKPFMKERGEKLNMPFDNRSGTYHDDSLPSASIHQAYRNVWDFSFWKEYFDQMARYRYNMVTLWSNSPFTAMTKVADYPNAALQNVQDSSGKVIITMSIDEKIAHWKKVMAYAKSRGFKFYLFVWSIYVGGAQRAYSTISEGSAGATDAQTIDFLYKSMTALLETYPDFDGFGVTGGENCPGASDAQKGNFFWQCYVKPMMECLQKNPSRKLTFIQRFHQTNISNVTPYYAPFRALPNARYLASFKFARCTMYSVAVPTTWAVEGAASKLSGLGLRTFHTIRNDDLYFLHWGDPPYARAFINGLPSTATFTEGIYIGPDGFTQTKCFHVKDALYKNDLEINRLWYRQMIWGRMSYNPTTPDDVFKNYLHLRYPQVDQNTLYTAWKNASQAFTVGNEFIRGAALNDYMYYPEGQNSSSGYRNISWFAGANPAPGSKLTNYTVVADSVKKMGTAALAALNSLNAGGNTELAINIKNLQALACLAVYVGEKIRGAELNQAGNKAAAIPVLGQAYCYWKQYADLMDQMHVGQQFTRVNSILPNWNTSKNSDVLNDYRTVGGTGTPTCTPFVGIVPPAPVALSKKPSMNVSALSSSSITLYLSSEQGFSLEIFSSNGAKVAELGNLKSNKGVSRFALGKKLTEGVYLVRLKSAGQTAVRQMNVCCD